MTPGQLSFHVSDKKVHPENLKKGGPLNDHGRLAEQENSLNVIMHLTLKPRSRKQKHHTIKAQKPNDQTPHRYETQHLSILFTKTSGFWEFGLSLFCANAPLKINFTFFAVLQLMNHQRTGSKFNRKHSTFESTHATKHERKSFAI